MKVIYIVTTGGTIDKVYSEQAGSVANLDSKIHRYLQHLRLPDTEIRVRTVLNKDSLEMTGEDRELILSVVKRLTDEKTPVIITHGTDTMVQTGIFLQRALREVQVPIVLTGAMTPLGFEGSDALQNLTESLIAVRLLPPGVYIVMHSQVFPADRVKKDHERARFVATDALGAASTTEIPCFSGNDKPKNRE